MKKLIFISAALMFLLGEAYSANPISVISPAYCSDIQGDTTINISAPGYTSVIVYCWKQGGGFGANSAIDTVMLDGIGAGSFVFQADEYPHGPITLRISGKFGVIPDNCYLQLYNKGGVSWNEGMPADPPPATSMDGMKLVFEDDFDNPDLSIGGDGSNKRYYDHKPPHGSQDFSYPLLFTGFTSSKNPFSQVDSYLRIRADATKNSTGLISSMYSNKSGFMVQAPCYFECRFVGPNAPGTWPAFWLLSVPDNINSSSDPCDELDIIEAYGGEGSGKPNSGPLYGIAAHAWNQTGAPVEIADDFYRKYFPVNMFNHGIPSTWYEAPHIYGCKINKDTTYYFCDNIEVGRHETMPISRVKPFFFMVNLATGGGWPVDLSRYNGITDMYVDYVRVYRDTTIVSVSGINLTPATASIDVGATRQLSASIIPVIATNDTINWISDNNSVATVNKNGLVTGVAAGSTTISATTTDGSYSASCAVTVNAVTGVSNHREGGISVNLYPNPITSESAIWIDSPNLADIYVDIFNVFGQSVFTYQTYQQGKIKVPIDMSNENKGIYIAKTCVGNLQFNRTIIK